MTVALPDFASARVLVAGDVMLDRYWYGATRRISPEAPVPVVKVEGSEDRPGGAGNVALSIAALGASAGLLGVVGQDEAAQSLGATLAAAGVDGKLLTVESLPTITKLRVISRRQQLIRLDFEEPLQVAVPADFATCFEELLARHDVVVLSDYAKGTLHDARRLIEIARDAGKTVLVDPKNPRFEIYRGATLMTPNLSELETMVGACPDEETLEEKGLRLVADLGHEALLVTRGENGMTLLVPGRPAVHLPSHAREVYDVTGAGDTVIATLAAGLAAGMTLADAAELSNLAAGILVSKLGAAAISAAELRSHLGSDPPVGVLNEDQLVAAVQAARARGERLIMTNGCFDILHAGHVAYLEKARKLGDRLIVAVNDDASVRALKGSGRPINGLERRMSVLAALSFVDWVVPFSETTPERLVCRVLPDVLVKGADYRPEEIAGSDCVRAAGGEVRVIDLVDGVSTTQMVQAGVRAPAGPSRETKLGPKQIPTSSRSST